MKKHVIISFGICLILIALSGFFLFVEYNKKVETQKKLILLYASDTKSKLDVIKASVKELSHIAKPMFDTDHKLIENVVSKCEENISMLERFYIENDYYVKDISVYDMDGAVFDLHRVNNDEFIPDYYKSRDVNMLRSELGVVNNSHSLSIIVPVYQGAFLAGNVAVNLELKKMQQELYKPYLQKGHIWATTIFDEETLLTLPFDDEWELSCENDLLLKIQERESGFLQGKIKGLESSVRVVTYFEWLPVPEHYLGIAFSTNISPLKASSICFFAVMAFILLVLAGFVSHFLNYETAHSRDEVKKKDQETRFLRTLFNDLPVGVIIVRDNTFFNANDFIFSLLKDHISANDIGKEIEEVNFPACFQSGNEEGKLCTFEKNGKEIFLSRQQIYFRQDETPYNLEIFWDATEIKQDLKEITRSEITRSELLSRLCADVGKTNSHIRDAVTLLLQQFPDEEHIAYINQQTINLLGLIDEVQDFTNIEAGQVALEETPFNLVDEIKTITDVYLPEITRKGIDLQTHIASSANRHVVGDPQRFRQIVNELLSNAVKFTNEGAIRIAMETTELQEGKLMINCSIDDTGLGIPQEKIKNLFSLDLCVNEKKDSIGLGVIFVKKLANMMGGSLQVASPSSISTNPSAPGTKFTFSITCFSDHQLDKQFNFSKITSYHQLHVLAVISDKNQMKSLIKFMEQKEIQTDTFVYNRESADLLTNKLIVDKSRYQMVIIATSNSETSFDIANKINRKGLTKDCLYVFIDTEEKKGNYLRAKYLNMDRYLIKSNDLSVYETLLKTYFPNLSDKNTSLDNFLSKDLQILIADNNILSQKVAQMIFQKLGYEVDVASNAVLLVKQLNHKKYDVIFMDLKFPPTDGFEIAEMLRAKDYQMPIVAITSNMTKKNIDRITECGMNGYLPKPLNQEGIRNLLSQWF